MTHHTTWQVVVLVAMLGPLSAYACDGKDVNAIGLQSSSQKADLSRNAIDDSDSDVEERC